MSPERARVPTIGEVRARDPKRQPSWTYLVTHPIAWVLVPMFIRVGFGPNAVSFTGAVTVIAGAFAYVWFDGAWWAGAIFLMAGQLGYACDAADGQLARITGTSSKFGGWFDLLLDRIVHTTVICTLMVARLPESGSSSEVAARLLPYLFLLVTSVAYHNGMNLREVFFPKGSAARTGGPALSSVAGALKTAITAAGDYGFLMFVLGVGAVTGMLEWAAWGMTAVYAVGLPAVVLRVRQLSAIESAERAGDPRGPEAHHS